MQKPFISHPALFVTSADLEHPSLQGLDGAEAVLDWPALEQIMAGIYASKTGRPSYPLLTLLRASLLGIWYRLSDVELAQTLFRDLLFIDRHPSIRCRQGIAQQCPERGGL